MPSTYTLNNGIELIGTGEQSGAWGDTTNTNFELLDTALDGQVSVALGAPGSSGSPNNLPISDGAASNGRNRMITFTDGTDLGATAYVQLTPNDSEKIIYVRNALSGSRSIILFQGTYNASNDYEVPAGTTAVVYFDGAGTGAVAANVFNNAHFDALNVVGNVTVGGDVTVTGTVDAGTVEFDNLSGTGAVSVTNILDEDNMASDSATALSTQQSIKAYVDAQVGTVDTLAEILANGNTTGGTDIVVSVDDVISMDNGTNLLPSLTTTGDLNTGLYFPAADEVGLTVAGTQRLNVNATGVDVTGALEVTTTALVTGVLTTTAATVFNGGFQSNELGFIIVADGDADNQYVAKIHNLESTDDRSWGLEIQAGSTAADLPLSIETHDSGTNLLQVAGSGQVRFVDGTVSLPAISNLGDLNTGIFFPAADEVGLTVAGTQRLNVNATGVDITGTLTSDGLTVQNASEAAGLFYGYSSITGVTSVSNGEIRIGQNSDFQGRISYDGQADGVLYVENSYNNAAADIMFRSKVAGTAQNKLLIEGTGDISFYEDDGTTASFVYYASSGTTFNEAGNDRDFRVESDTLPNAFFVNGATSKIGIGEGAVGGTDDWTGSSWTGLMFKEGSTIASFQAAAYPAINITENGFPNGTSFQSGFLRSNTGLATNIQLDRGDMFFRTAASAAAGSEITWVATLNLLDNSNGAVFNEGGSDRDFRVESDSNTHALFVDGGANHVNIGTATDLGGMLNVAGPAIVSYNSGDIATLTIQDTGTSQAGLNIKAGSGSTNRASRINFFNNVTSTSTPRWAILNDYLQNGANDFTIADSAATKFLRLTSNHSDGGAFVINEDSDGVDFRVESDSNANALFVDASTNIVHLGGSTQDTSTGFLNCGGITFSNGAAGGGKFLSWDNEGGTGSQSLLGYWFDGSSYRNRFRMAGDTGITTVNGSGDDVDFRVSSDTNANAFVVDAGSNNVCFGAGVASGTTNMGYFHVNDLNCHLSVTNTQTSDTTACYYANRQNSNGKSMLFKRAGSTVGTITVTTGATSYNTTSDYRLKENVVYDWDATTRLKQLKPARFNFIVDADTTVDGFLAHEAQAVVPECATGTHNEVDDNGDAVMQGIDQSKLVPLLVKTIQELEARITALENA